MTEPVWRPRAGWRTMGLQTEVAEPGEGMWTSLGRRRCTETLERRQTASSGGGTAADEIYPNTRMAATGLASGALCAVSLS